MTLRRWFLVTAAATAWVAGCRGSAPPAAAPSPAATPIRTRATLPAALDSIVNAREFRNANWGVLVVRPPADTLYSHNAGKIFMPASNQKLLTSAVALAQLGPDFRYRTTVVGPAISSDGRIDGNLAVIGRGDPSVSDHMRRNAMLPLREIADSLYARGVRRVTGRVVAAGDAFSDAVLGFGWSWEDLESGYSAASDELLFNEGISTVVVRAGAAVGDPVRVETRPARTFPHVIVTARTVGRPMPGDSGRRAGVSVVKDTVSGAMRVSGTLAMSDSSSVVVTHRDPGAAYVAALREAIEARGIVVEGTDRPVTERGDTLAVLVSPPLSEILPALMKPSQNQLAEMLFKTLGLERGRAGTPLEGRRVVEAQLTAWGAPEGGFVVRDGSGLSRYDYISPETIIRVLDAMRRSPHFDLYFASMPIGGVDGTLRSRMRGTPAENNVRAKTGSVAQSRALSGYVRTADGELLLFSALANNWTTPARDVERALDSIAVRVATLRIR
jgi:D-alanyl-D-alanine carboxypeptidase/D-alanyl-D-alanine-endopeptidase (penicillin-binding protein 4)